MIHLICALKCEAKSLIAHYRLKNYAASESFPCYISQDKQMSLTICGIGKINAAAATAFTHAFLQTSKQDTWLNIGIAGHKELEIGEIIIAHKIIEQSTHHTWYPQILCSPSCQSKEVLSCDRPALDYTETVSSGAVFEMEAAGFYAAASRFATSELIHVVKIISDNQHQPVDEISASLVADLIKDKLKIIDHLITSLHQLTKYVRIPNKSPDYYDQIIEQWQFIICEK